MTFIGLVPLGRIFLRLFKILINSAIANNLMWNAHFDVLGETRPDLPHISANTQLYVADIVVVSWKLGINNCTNRVLSPGPVVSESITLFARPQRLPCFDLYSR